MSNCWSVLLRSKPLFADDKIAFGLLMLCLGVVFYTSNSQHKFWKTCYKYIPALLMCYMLPAILNSMGVISSKETETYNMAKNYLLPASLVLMTLSIDSKAIGKLGSKSLIMFFATAFGIMVGSLLAIMMLSLIWPAIAHGVVFFMTALAQWSSQQIAPFFKVILALEITSLESQFFWMLIYVVILIVVAKIIKAPYFFLAVRSKANIGGAASGPVVAVAFHPVLAPVGVLIAVLGYALGTYGVVICPQLMELASKSQGIIP